jgi:hypothetical protein
MAKQFTKRTLVTGPAKASTTTTSITKARSTTVPTEQQIRARAYEIYLRRKGGPGDAHADWLQAEQELKGQLST